VPRILRAPQQYICEAKDRKGSTDPAARYTRIDISSIQSISLFMQGVGVGSTNRAQDGTRPDVLDTMTGTHMVEYAHDM
jgi:hypothetical protein